MIVAEIDIIIKFMIKVLNMEEKTYDSFEEKKKAIFPRRYELDQVKKQLKTAHPSFYAIYMRKPLNDD